MGSRNFLVRELLKNVKASIKMKIHRFPPHHKVSLPHDIILGKYYLVKAKLRMAEDLYPKALKNLLECLHYTCDRRTTSGPFPRQPENDKSLYLDAKRNNFYDPIDTLEALKLIETIIEKDKIPCPPHMLAALERDIEATKKTAAEYSKIYKHFCLMEYITYFLLQANSISSRCFTRKMKTKNRRIVQIKI